MTIQEYVDSNKDYIIKQYESGISSTKIARELKVNNYYISKLLNYNHVSMRNRPKFSTEQINLLVPKMKEMFDNGLSIYKICKELGTDEATTSRRLKSLGCDTNKKSTQRDDKLFNHTQEIIEMYNSGINTPEITKKFNCGNSAIWNLLQKNGIECRDRNKYSANYDYFERIDSDEKAYVVGLIYADGHVKTKSHVWGIQLIDEDLVKEICKRVEYTGRIHYKKPRIKFETHLCKPMYELLISSQKMKEDLIRLGVVPNKTLILKYPTVEQVPLEFMNSFIRGYLDGDGSVGYAIGKNDKSPRFKVQFTSTLEMCKGIKLEIKNQLDIDCKIYKANSKNDKNTYYCVIDGEKCVKFLDWLYQYSTIHLERKWRKYMQLKEYFEYRHLLITPAGRKKKKV